VIPRRSLTATAPGGGAVSPPFPCSSAQLGPAGVPGAIGRHARDDALSSQREATSPTSNGLASSLSKSIYRLRRCTSWPSGRTVTRMTSSEPGGSRLPPTARVFGAPWRRKTTMTFCGPWQLLPSKAPLEAQSHRRSAPWENASSRSSFAWLHRRPCRPCYSSPVQRANSRRLPPRPRLGRCACRLCRSRLRCPVQCGLTTLPLARIRVPRRSCEKGSSQFPYSTRRKLRRA